MKIDIKDIRAGDIVSASRRDNSSVVFQGEVKSTDSEWVYMRYAYPMNNSNWLFELVFRPVELPTKENAVVGHRTDGSQEVFVLQGGNWLVPGTQWGMTEDEVRHYMESSGLEVLFEGV